MYVRDSPKIQCEIDPFFVIVSKLSQERLTFTSYDSIYLYQSL